MTEQERNEWELMVAENTQGARAYEAYRHREAQQEKWFGRFLFVVTGTAIGWYIAAQFGNPINYAGLVQNWCWGAGIGAAVGVWCACHL